MLPCKRWAECGENRRQIDIRYDIIRIELYINKAKGYEGGSEEEGQAR